MQPKLELISSTDKKEISLECDNHFKNSIKHFYNCIVDNFARQKKYKDILLQSTMIESVKGKGE